MVIIITLICTDVELKYPHGDFENFGDLLQSHIFLYASRKDSFDHEEIIPKPFLNDITQTFFKGQKLTCCLVLEML